MFLYVIFKVYYYEIKCIKNILWMFQYLFYNKSISKLLRFQRVVTDIVFHDI